MGSDSIEPFLAFENKFAIMLALTSNKGGLDFQVIEDDSGEALYERVLKTSLGWANSDRLMYVVGATRPEYFERIRRIVPDHFLLVPGVGAQGGSLKEVCQYGLNSVVGLLINSSRGIIYASQENDFAAKSAEKAEELQKEMAAILSGAGLSS